MALVARRFSWLDSDHPILPTPPPSTSTMILKGLHEVNPGVEQPFVFRSLP
jgi:hypothetical protein